ncbi:MAG TPA: hypothetical protein VFH60_04845, partial [Chloroflexia bacterium]|nr:hypothetical protein [Chloroflexia bacterium]
MKARQRIQKGFSIAGFVVMALALAGQSSTAAFASTLGSGKVPSQPNAVQYVVNNTNDSGAGSLREAINMANAGPGKDSIIFNIPGSGVKTISPLSALPAITDPVEIDGTTQPGYTGTPVIELNGSSAGWPQAGLVVSAGNSTIKGLVINRFNAPNIKLTTNGGNTLEGNFIGTNPAGTASMMTVGTGILIDGTSSNVIGGTTNAARNLISGNGANGIVFVETISYGTRANQVLGNYIGTDINGTAAISNTFNGVVMNNAHDNVVGSTAAGAGNLISGNGLNGVYIEMAIGARVRGNYIGTD